MTSLSGLELLTAPPSRAAATVELADRRTKTRWSVRVKPFLLAATPVTTGLYGQARGREVAAGERDLAATDVSWRAAVSSVRPTVAP